MDNVFWFRIAELNIKLTFAEGGLNSMALLPSFNPFRIAPPAPTAACFFHLRIDDRLKPMPAEQRERIKAFDTGNGKTIVDKLRPDGGYQFIIKNLQGASCCLLICNSNFTECQCALNGSYEMRNFGLNNALMHVFSFAGSQHNVLLMHASCVRKDGIAYPFVAASGTGKSTQVSFWLRYIPGCDLLNDDNPIVRIMPNGVFIYGSPWSGKTPCYRNTKATLGAITRVARAQQNQVQRLTGIEAFASVLPSCATMKWEPAVHNGIINSLSKLIEVIPVYTLHCLPNKESAVLCCNTITQQKQTTR